MRRSQQLVGLLWRWHRRFGLLAAVFVLLLVVTGIALNHTDLLTLDRRFVENRWLLSLYGAAEQQPTAFPVANSPATSEASRWISRTAGGHLYLDEVEVASCRGELFGALVQNGVLLVACEQELVLITSDGQLLETISSSTGLPVPLTGLGRAGAAAAIKTEVGWLRADVDRLTFTPDLPSGVIIQQLTGGKLPATIHDALPKGARWLTWERLLQDLHSGRLFGSAGVYFMDFIALCLASLASSGVAMWFLHRRRKGRR